MLNRSNNSAFPFETIATAIALSPRAENILHESKRLAEQFNAELILIHVGKKTEEKKNKLDALLNKAASIKKNLLSFGKMVPLQKVFWIAAKTIKLICLFLALLIKKAFTNITWVPLQEICAEKLNALFC